MKAQTSVEFLLLLAATLVTLAGILAYLVASSSSMGSSVSGEVENTRQEASNILKSHLSFFPNLSQGPDVLGAVECGHTARFDIDELVRLHTGLLGKPRCPNFRKSGGKELII
jgi:hypothetical protein